VSCAAPETLTVAQGGKLQAQRLQFEGRLRSCDPDVATFNSSRELTVGSSSKEKPTVARAVTVAARSSVFTNTLKPRPCDNPLRASMRGEKFGLSFSSSDRSLLFAQHLADSLDGSFRVGRGHLAA
jgi:hypothetical protein